MFLGVDGKIQVLPPSKFEDGSGQSLLLESEASFWVLPTPETTEQPNPYHQNLAKAKLRSFLPGTRKTLPPATEGRSPNNSSAQHQAFARFLIPHQPCNAAWVVIRIPQKLMPGACFELPNRVSHLKRRSEPLGPSTL
ncbi:uncharacterized protein PADG_11404 [Paracoccidioides brasiliensis Pb18]|uniref:Uncharacterized protein n=1 Tax=Paracoccidioides brasiliensis (strain Pb18) TaxID=502780 RepID=A0A0A0HVZ6_PARBD|nr:uncharacterized protein PADG_11404 [Paracoccidioides brasiliensis Pb18]KGM92573.1 hypothetical protein PADG_11404 [Paracoccidioides brasiliensis Pb18]